MNQEVLKKTIKNMEKQIREQQKIVDRLKKAAYPSYYDIELSKKKLKVEHTEISDSKKHFPLDWNKKIVEINYTDGTSNYYGINSPQPDTEPTCPASKIW